MMDNREIKRARRKIKKQTGIRPNTVSFPAGISFKERTWRERLFTRPWRPWVRSIVTEGLVDSWAAKCGVIAPDGLPVSQYICPKHGVVSCAITFANGKGYNRSFCIECVGDLLDKHLGQIYQWNDELTKHDFEEKET